MQKVFVNIEAIQKKVKDSVNNLLLSNGYSLITEESFSNCESLLLQWTNEDRNHSFQLLWDIRERWFILGEFNRTNDLNYFNSTEIKLFPYKAIGVIFRKRYDSNYVSKIILTINENLQTSMPSDAKQVKLTSVHQ